MVQTFKPEASIHVAVSAALASTICAAGPIFPSSIFSKPLSQENRIRIPGCSWYLMLETPLSFILCGADTGFVATSQAGRGQWGKREGTLLKQETCEEFWWGHPGCPLALWSIKCCGCTPPCSWQTLPPSCPFWATKTDITTPKLATETLHIHPATLSFAPGQSELNLLWYGKKLRDFFTLRSSNQKPVSLTCRGALHSSWKLVFLGTILTGAGGVSKVFAITGTLSENQFSSGWKART